MGSEFRETISSEYRGNAVSFLAKLRRSFHLRQQFVEKVGVETLEFLNTNPSPKEVVEFVEKTTENFRKLPDTHHSTEGDRGRAMTDMEIDIDRNSLIQALIPPKLADIHGLFDQIWGVIDADRRQWKPELKNAPHEKMVSFLQNKYDTEWYPKD